MSLDHAEKLSDRFANSDTLDAWSRPPQRLASAVRRSERRSAAANQTHEPRPMVLLRAARSGNERAFEALIADELPRIEALCWSLVRRPADFDDAVQEALTAAWRSLPQYEGRHGATLRTWLYRVTQNAVTSLYRRERWAVATHDPGEHRADPMPGPERESVVAIAVRDALNQLPDDFRTAVVLADQFGLSYREIADIQIVAEATVKTRVFRARRALQHLLGDARV